MRQKVDEANSCRARVRMEEAICEVDGLLLEQRCRLLVCLSFFLLDRQDRPGCATARKRICHIHPKFLLNPRCQLHRLHRALEMALSIFNGTNSLCFRADQRRCNRALRQEHCSMKWAADSIVVSGTSHIPHNCPISFPIVNTPPGGGRPLMDFPNFKTIFSSLFLTRICSQKLVFTKQSLNTILSQNQCPGTQMSDFQIG